MNPSVKTASATERAIDTFTEIVKMREILRDAYVRLGSCMLEESFDYLTYMNETEALRERYRNVIF